MEDLSEFERRAIATLASADAQGDVILAQLTTARCTSRDYTGVGLYTELQVDPGAPTLDESRWQIEDMPHGTAEHPEVPAGAGLILWVKDGRISCLEAYTYEGSWPKDEPLFRLAPNNSFKGMPLRGTP